MKIQKVTDPAFRKYGKVLEGYNFSALLKEMKSHFQNKWDNRTPRHVLQVIFLLP